MRKPVYVSVTGVEGAYIAAVYSGDAALTDGNSSELYIDLEQSDGHCRISLGGVTFDSFEKSGNVTTLKKRIEIPELITYLEITVRYEVIGGNLIKKDVTLLQRNAPQIRFRMKNIIKSPEKPDKYWAFDEYEANGKTDMTYQRFPAAGYKVNEFHVGIISENGYINDYVRNRRKRKIVEDFGYDAFEPIKTLPDPNLMFVSEKEQSTGFTFGEYKTSNGETGFYNILPLGKPKTKTFYIYAFDAPDIRTLKLDAQEAYCDGCGFTGSLPEKVLFACARINITRAEIYDNYPHSVPAPIGYAPDMYNRDTFWTITGCGDKDLNELLLARWFDTQDERGCIGTIITPVTGSIEVKDNDSTILMFLWAWHNNKKYGGHNISNEKIEMAYKYCRNTLDPENTGRCTAHFALSQQDISHYEDGEQLSVNQGMYAVFLRAAMMMGFDVEKSYLESVEENYRSYYDNTGHTLRLTMDDTISTSFDNLVPEFLSLWLFGHKMLTDEQVCDMLNNYPDSKVCGAKSLFIKRNGDNLTLDEWPFKKNEYNKPGTYYNGGSWLRGEVMAYATGYLHGYSEGKTRILHRLQAELDRFPDDPVIHEFLPTDMDYPYDDWIRNNSVFSWNVFALVAEELIGIR